MFKKLPNSIRKFIRSEKARIRRDILDPKKQEEMIKDVYNKLLNKQSDQENVKKPKVEKKQEVNQKSKMQKSKKEKSKIEKTKKGKKKNK
jgi:hypothetical protein